MEPNGNKAVSLLIEMLVNADVIFTNGWRAQMIRFSAEILGETHPAVKRAWTLHDKIVEDLESKV